jgi:DNA-binding response OmpR family regulator
MSTQKSTILLMEDDPNLSLVLKDYFEMNNINTVHSENGELGLKEFKSRKFDLVILDVMMPKMDGFKVAEKIRAMDKETPVIFLTARGMKEDRIKGFQIGCDDYITKPFSTEELSLRIEAILKRCKTNITEQKDLLFEIGEFSFDYTNMMLKRNSDQRKLTRKEAELLKLLATFKNKLLTREYALNTIWGDSDYFVGRSMDVFITKLRKYLKDDPQISINNVHGTGFKLEVNE